MITIIEPKSDFSFPKNTIILDASAVAIYEQGHIPNSISIPPQTLYSYIESCSPFMPNFEAINDLLEYIGYQENFPIVVLDSEGGGWAGRLLWTLSLAGLKNLYYLNGGQIAWRSQNLELTQDIYSPTKTAYDLSHDLSFLATQEDILNTLNTSDALIWDSRSYEEFIGEKSGSMRHGAIPGAIHCEWTELMDDRGCIIKNASTYLQSKGINGNKPIIVYCQSNHRSGFTWLVGNILGWDIKSYSGGWSEWGNSSDTPIAV